MFSETTRITRYGRITVERLHPTGAIYLYDGQNKQTYMGYTVRDALAMFRKTYPARGN